jgi:hypothetical protein
MAPPALLCLASLAILSRGGGHDLVLLLFPSSISGCVVFFFLLSVKEKERRRLSLSFI